MPIIKPDLSEVQELTPIPQGTYKAKIISVEVKTSSKGNPMCVPKFEVDVPGEKARVRTAFLITSGAGAFNFDSLLRACHFESVADQMKVPGSNVEFDTDQLIGQECMVVIEPDTYENQLRDKIKTFLPL